jgi:pimeloyl-ACP methyl ester carboxylesterase
MQHVTSKDGTRIAYWRCGSGPPLIVIGGALADHQFYVPLASELAKHFTVYNFDRRGRGQSEDAPNYAITREIEDVTALSNEATEPVVLYGHSAGAALALRAAASGLNIAKLVLADPPFTPHGDSDELSRAAFLEEGDRVRELHARGDYEGCVKFFLSGMGLPNESIEQLLQSAAKDSMLDCARALPYDYAMLGDGLVPTDLAARVKVPTVILADRGAPEAAQALVDAMPDAHFEAMDGPAFQSTPADLVARFARLLGLTAGAGAGGQPG